MLFSFRGHLCGSTTSSIFDLSSESERFEQAIRDNNIETLRKLLDVHLSRFNLVTPETRSCGTGTMPPAGVGPPAFPPGWDNWSFVDSRSDRTRSLSTASVGRRSVCSLQPTNEPFPSAKKTSLTNHHPHSGSSSGVLLSVDGGQSKGDGSCGLAEGHEGPLPTVFRNAIHLAIQHNSVDALTLLLVSGVDPNRPGSGGGGGGGSATDPQNVLLLSDKTASSSSSARERHKVSFVEDSLASGGCRAHKTSTDDVFLIPQTPADNPSLSSGRKIAGATLLKSSALPKANLRRIKSLRHDRCLYVCESQKRERREQVSVVDYSVDHLFDLPPLFFAVTQRNHAAVNLLLRYGASPIAVDNHGCSPLHLSSGEQFESATCTAALIEYGAKVHQTNDEGVAPSHLTPELVVRQTQLLRDKLQQLASTALQAASGDNGGKQHSADNSRFGSRLFRRSHHKNCPGSSTATARDLSGKGSETRDSLDKDSLFNNDRPGSVGSSKSRASNGGGGGGGARVTGPCSVSPALSGRSDEAPLESLASGNSSAVEKASKAQVNRQYIIIAENYFTHFILISTFLTSMIFTDLLMMMICLYAIEARLV